MPNDTICLTNQASITPVVAGGNGPYNYIWSNGQTNTTLLVSPNTSSSYTVTVTDANNCSATQQINIIVRLPIAITLTPDTTICAGSSVTLNATASGGDGNYSFSWNNGLSTNASIVFTPGTDTTLNLIVSDGCSTPPVSGDVTVHVTIINLGVLSISNVKCKGGTDGAAAIQIISGGTSPFSVNWSNGNTTFNNQNISNGVYTATVTDFNGCTQSISVTITEPSLLTVSSNPDQTICISQSINLSPVTAGGILPYSFQWSNGITSSTNNVAPVTTTPYTITVTDGNGCTAASSTLITVFPALQIINITNDTTICRGKTIKLSVTVSGGNGLYQYNWSGNNTQSNISVTPLNDTTLTVNIDDGCTQPSLTDSVHITVKPAPIADFGWEPGVGCIPLEVAFSDSSQTISGSTYVWLFGDGNNSSLTGPVHIYQTAGTYDVTLTVTSPLGCKSTMHKPAIIEVHTPIKADFTFTPNQPALISPEVRFYDLSTQNPNYWFWDFGVSNATAAIQNPAYTYQDTGTYLVTLIVKNQYNCTDTVQREVRMIDLFSFYIPNAFSPNNDGHNDKFEVLGMNYSSFDVMIFNRWGQLIHQAKSNPVWDGNDNNGEPAQSGTYVYLITAYELFTGTKHEYRGVFSLIR